MILYAFLIFTHFAFAADSGRVDPHGSKEIKLEQMADLKAHKECTTCHLQEGKRITLKPNAKTSCSNCHNKAPHSGVVEHMDKLYKLASSSERIDCLSCHSPHRVEGKVWENPSGFFKSLAPTTDLPVRSNSNAMIKRTCTECHKW